MLILIAARLPLLIGPLIVDRALRERRLRDVVDGFIFVSIAGLVLLDILPHLIGHLGWAALLLVALGYWGPSFVEQRFRAAAHSTHVVVVLVAALGLIVHTLADGAVLSDAEQPGLALAVLLHRLPVAMTVWWLLRPAWGPRGAGLMLAAMALGTAAGWLAGVQWIGDGLPRATLEALVAGSILHVVFNRVHLNPELDTGPQDPRAEGSGNLLGLGFLLLAFGVGLEMPAQMRALGDRLYELSLIAAPALLLGYTLAGLLAGMVPVRSFGWIGRGSTLRQSFNGMLVGLPLPVCSCGVVPLYRSLLQRGVPPAAGLSFLIATPELGLDALIVSLPLLGLDMTLARLVAAALIAWGVGALLGRWVQVRAAALSGGCSHAGHDHDHGHSGHSHSHSHGLEQPGAGPDARGAWAGLRYGYTDLLDATIPWLLLGLVVAALAAPMLELVPGWGLPMLAEVAVFALLGMPLYVCATGSTPIVAVMLVSGVSPGACLAFLITGPATNPATFGVLSQLHGRRAALAFAALTAGLAISAGLLVELWGGLDVDPQVLDKAHQGWWQPACLLLLALLLGWAVLRRGARALVAELRPSHG